MSQHATARTELARLIHERRMSYEEFAEYVEKYARDHGEPGTLSVRHVQRLAVGKRDDGKPLGPVRKATARLLERIFSTDIETLLGPPKSGSRPVPELARLIGNSKKVSPHLIALLKEQIAMLRRLDRELGARVAYNEVKAKERQVSELRKYSLTPSMRTELGILQAELCTLAGWQAFDLGDSIAAWNFYEKSKAAAADAGQLLHLSYAHAEQASILIDLGMCREAVDVLEALDRRGAPSLLRSWFSAALGEAYAAAGRSKESQRSFDEAMCLPLGEPSINVPYVALDEVSLQRWRASALAKSGDIRAATALESSLQRMDPSSVRAVVSLRVDLVGAYLLTKNLVLAQNHLDQALRSAEEIGSVRHSAKLRVLEHKLACA